MAVCVAEHDLPATPIPHNPANLRPGRDSGPVYELDIVHQANRPCPFCARSHSVVAPPNECPGRDSNPYGLSTRAV